MTVVAMNLLRKRLIAKQILGNYTIKKNADIGAVLSNEQASVDLTVSLPYATPNQLYHFQVDSSNQITLDPYATDQIANLEGVYGGAGKYLYAGDVGSKVTIKCIKTGFWDITAVVGSWLHEGSAESSIKDEDYTVTDSDNIIEINADSNTVEISLPPVATYRGKDVLIKAVDAAYAATIATNASEQIDKESSVTLLEGAAYRLAPNNDKTGWIIIGSVPGSF